MDPLVAFYIAQGVSVVTGAIAILLKQLKKMTHIFIFEIIANSLAALNYFFLFYAGESGMSGAFVSGLAAFNSLLMMLFFLANKKPHISLTVVFICIYTGFSVYNVIILRDLMEILPALSAFCFSVSLMQKKPSMYRLWSALNPTFWFVYDLYSAAYVMSIVHFGIIASGVIGMIRLDGLFGIVKRKPAEEEKIDPDRKEYLCGGITMNKKIGISINNLQAIYGDKRALEIAKEVGADAVDLMTDHHSVSKQGSVYTATDGEIEAYFAELRQHAKTLAIDINQTHGRLRICKNDPELDKICLEDARRDLLAARALGAKYCVMHGVATGAMGPDTPPEVMRELNYEIFGKILVYAKEYGVKVATESLGDSPIYNCRDFFGSAKEFKDTFDRICADGNNADYFTICIDTGHVHKATRFDRPKVGDVIRMMGKGISCLHLHDNDTFKDQHKPPFTGSIDWNDVFDALDEVGYDGVYNLEMHLPCFGKGFEIETAEFSAKLMRHALSKRYGE